MTKEDFVFFDLNLVGTGVLTASVSGSVRKKIVGLNA